VNEAVLALIGLVVCAAVAIGALAYAEVREAAGLGGFVAVLLLVAGSSLAGLYFLIRLVHWAWATAIST
jgi:hypothetical protein